MSLLIEWGYALMAIAAGIYSLGVYLRAKSRANAAILDALSVMEKKWDVMVSAGDDVPPSVLENMYFMVKVARKPETRVLLLSALARSDDASRDMNGKTAIQIRGMRDPLQKVFEEFLIAWFTVVSSGNLFARMFIRFSLGKLALRNSSVNPVARGAMRAAGRVKARHDKADRHDNNACA